MGANIRLAVYCTRRHRQIVLRVSPEESAAVEAGRSLMAPRARVIDQRSGHSYDIYIALRFTPRARRRRSDLEAVQVPS